MDTVKTESAPDGEGRAIAVSITMSTSLTEKRNIVMQTYLGRDDSIATYNAVLDKIGRATDSQEAKYKLVDLQVALGQHEKTLAQLIEDYKNIETKSAALWQSQGKKGDPKLNAAEAAQKGNAEQTMKRYRVEIAKIKSEIEQCAAEIARTD